ncbi:unnamed protein product [Phytophthora fragariaefolia]|uniref:Unnamed protein product n=1 Tax=Phytophthora fragariaefolia TaxID=1490495 RepID=A0A9W7DAR6_9STRA|nr:unnamed protein product [Phytophthora fragariaefolia]
MSMRDYVQKARHLVSCIVTNPIDVAFQVHVFIFGMREGMTRYCQTQAEPATLDAAFALALREDYTVAPSYARVLTPDVRVSTPEPMEIDAIEVESRLRSSPTSRGPRPNKYNSLRYGRQLVCYRWRKLGHCAAVCIAPAPVLASAKVVGNADDTFPAFHPKKRSGAVGAGRPTGWNGGLGPPVATGPPSLPVLHAHFNATATCGDSRLILISLHVADVERPLRALLDNGATNDFIRGDCLALLPPRERVRNGPGEIVVKLADGKFPPENYVVQQRIPLVNASVEQRLMFADVPVAQAPTLRDAGVVERELPCLEGGEVSPSEPSCSETSASSSGSRRLRKSPHNRSGRPRLRRRAPSVEPVQHREVLNVVEYEEGSPNRVRTIEVANPPSDAAAITRLPGLSWKHFLRDLKAGEIEQICLLTSSDQPAVLANTVSDDVSSSRPKAAEPKSVSEERFAAQSWAALQDSNNPVYSLAREFENVFPEKIPAELPAERGVRHGIDLVPGSQYCVIRQWPLPRDQIQAINDFFDGRRKAGHVRDSTSPHSIPTFCVKKATGGWCIVHAFNKFNDATIPAQTPIPRKDMVLDTMSGSVIYSAIDLRDGFYQILVRESDIPLTAVSTLCGMLWEWLVMPQGLKNALATFNRMVSHVLRPLRVFAPSTSMTSLYTVALRMGSAPSIPVLPLGQPIADAYDDDAFYAGIIGYLRNPTADALAKLTRPTRDTITRYALNGDLLTYAIDTFDTPRVVIPADDDLRARLWIRKWVRSCEVCQRVKPAASQQAPLRPLPIATSAWRSISMEFIFGLPRDAQDRTGILVFVDRFSKMVHLAPVAAVVTADGTAELFLALVFRHHDLPESIVSDRDPRFTSAFWTRLFALLGTRLRRPIQRRMAPTTTPSRYVRDALQAAGDQQKANADRRGRKNMLSSRRGDRVLLSTDDIQGSAVTNLGANKLAPRFIGPFKILKVIGDAYTLDIPTSMRPHPTFDVGRLKPYVPATIPALAADRLQPARSPSVPADAASARALAPHARAWPSEVPRRQESPDDEAATSSHAVPAPTGPRQL